MEAFCTCTYFIGKRLHNLQNKLEFIDFKNYSLCPDYTELQCRSLQFCINIDHGLLVSILYDYVNHRGCTCRIKINVYIHFICSNDNIAGNYGDLLALTDWPGQVKIRYFRQVFWNTWKKTWSGPAKIDKVFNTKAWYFPSFALLTNESICQENVKQKLDSTFSCHDFTVVYILYS